MRYLLLAVMVAATTAYVCHHGFDRDDASATWDFSQTRAAGSIDWPDDRPDASADHWRGHREQLTIKPPRGSELTFHDVDFSIDRDKGRVAFVRLKMSGLSHERMLAESRRLCGAWHSPQMSQRVAEVFPHAVPAPTAPATWISQGPGTLIRVSHEGPTETPWCVEVDLTFKK